MRITGKIRAHVQLRNRKPVRNCCFHKGLGMRIQWKSDEDRARVWNGYRRAMKRRQTATRDRCNVIILLGDGGPEGQELDPEQIAAAVERSRRFVNQWALRYRAIEPRRGRCWHRPFWVFGRVQRTGRRGYFGNRMGCRRQPDMFGWTFWRISTSIGTGPAASFPVARTRLDMIGFTGSGTGRRSHFRPIRRSRRIRQCWQTGIILAFGGGDRQRLSRGRLPMSN